MNVRTKAATIFWLIAGLAAFGIGLSAEDSAKELAALQAVDQSWLKAYNAGDVDTLASLYDEHAVLLPPGAPAVNGRAAIRAFFAKDTAESKEAGVTTSAGPNPAGGVSGDMGWQSGTYAVKDTSGKVVDTGNYSLRLREEERKVALCSRHLEFRHPAGSSREHCAPEIGSACSIRAANSADTLVVSPIGPCFGGAPPTGNWGLLLAVGVTSRLHSQPAPCGVLSEIAWFQQLSVNSKD